MHIRILIMMTGLLGAVAVPAAVSAPWVQVSPPERRALSPEIAIGTDGAINVIWLDKGFAASRPPPKLRKPGRHSHLSSTDLYFSRSEDGGKNWSKPVRVNDRPGEVWGFAVSKPRIAVGPTGTIHVFFPGNETSPVTGLDVVTAQYTRSTDNGRSFEKARTINRPADLDKTGLLGEGLSATFSFGTMGVGPNGVVYAVWQDMGPMQTNADGAEVHVAISHDDGRNFSSEHAALEGSQVCPCCQLTMAFDKREVYLGYRKIYSDGRDSTVAISDDGNSFSTEARLPFGRWKIDGCPLKPTEVAVDGRNVYAAAYTGGEEPAGVYFSRSTDGGRTFDGATQVHPQAAYSDAPQLAVSSDGVVWVVWLAKTGGPRRLFMAWSMDEGRTLSEPHELETPEGSSAYPALAADPAGSVYVAWQQQPEQVFVRRLPAPVRGTQQTAP